MAEPIEMPEIPEGWELTAPQGYFARDLKFWDGDKWVTGFDSDSTWHIKESTNNLHQIYIDVASDKWSPFHFTYKTGVKYVRDDIHKQALAQIAQFESMRDSAMTRECEDEQVLGKVLGFPYYCDDQKNFPGTTEEDGVCTGPYVLSDLVELSAKKITELEAEVKQLREMVRCAGEVLNVFVNHPKADWFIEGNGTEFKRGWYSALETLKYSAQLSALLPPSMEVSK